MRLHELREWSVDVYPDDELRYPWMSNEVRVVELSLTVYLSTVPGYGAQVNQAPPGTIRGNHGKLYIHRNRNRS